MKTLDSVLVERDEALAALARATTERDALHDRVERLVAALAFARSVIKCGEPWTATCDQVIDGAIFNTSTHDKEP